MWHYSWEGCRKQDLGELCWDIQANPRKQESRGQKAKGGLPNLHRWETFAVPQSQSLLVTGYCLCCPRFLKGQLVLGFR